MTPVSVWEKESFFAHRDLTIVGGGFVGLWCAYHIKKRHPKLSVSIIDRGLIPTGASTRNAGFACFGSVTELLADTKKMGEDNMLHLVEMRFKGLQRIRKIFKAKDIGWLKQGGYELITSNQSYTANALRSQLDRLNHKLRKIVGGKAFFLNNHKIKEFGFSSVAHLIENPLEAQLHSGKLCEALMRLVQSMGVTILNNIPISGFEKINGVFQLQNDHGLPLTAGRLLICTNAFARELLPALDVEPARGQVLVTSPFSRLPFRGTFHYDEGFYYFRDLGNRILLGGARNKAFEEEHSAAMTTTDLIQQELERFLREVIRPREPYQIDLRWSGIMAMGQEKLPLVQKISEDLYCAVRMGGMGVALAPEIGKQLAREITY